MKLVAVLQIDDGWVDVPDVSPAYVFNNTRDLLNTFNDLGVVEIVEEPNPNNLYEFGTVTLDRNNFKFTFTCMYADTN